MGREARRLSGWTGATIVAALSVLAGLMILGGTAAGVETVPENTVAPTISPTAPREGETVTASQGTWNGSPTSFTYAWYRCTGSEACTSIPSATGSTYMPSAADVGHTLRVVVTASNTKGSGSAISAATSATKVSAPPPYYWNSCKKTGTGEYTNATCSVLGVGGFEWTKIAASTPTSFTAASSTSFTLRATIFGAVKITCTSQTSEGTLENPAEAKTAIVSSSSFKLAGCAVSEPAGCKVETTLKFKTIKGSAVEGEGAREVKIEPLTGSETVIVNLEITECAISGTYGVKGSFGGIDNPSTSSLEFTKASSAAHIGTEPVTLEGTTKIQTSAGEALKLTP